MYLIDVQRPLPAVVSFLHPSGIMKGIRRHVPDKAGVLRPQFHAESIGVTVIPKAPVLPPDPVFIHVPRLRLRDQAFPEISVVNLFHRRLLPIIEGADHRNLLRRRCKRLKHRTRLLRPASQKFICIKNFPGIKSIHIHNRFRCPHPRRIPADRGQSPPFLPINGLCLFDHSRLFC